MRQTALAGREGGDIKIWRMMARFGLFFSSNFFCLQRESASPVAGRCERRQRSASAAISRFRRKLENTCSMMQ